MESNVSMMGSVSDGIHFCPTETIWQIMAFAFTTLKVTTTPVEDPPMLPFTGS